MDDGTSRQRFAERLRELLDEYDGSRKGLATRLKRSEAALTNWSKGDNLPDKVKVVEALEALLVEGGVRLQPGELVELWTSADRERRLQRGDRHRRRPQGNEDPPLAVEVEAGSRTHRRSMPAGRWVVPAALLLLIAGAGLYLRTWQRPPATETAPIVNPIYLVDANRATGAHVHELPPGGRVEQWFTATQRAVIRVAAIIGRDPNTSPPPIPDGGEVGRVRFQLLDDGDKVLADRTVQARNNVETVVSLTPVRVELGTRYVLRVTNRADVVLGFYFNRNPHPQDSTILYGAVDPPGVSPHEHALSGQVLGSLLNP